MNFDVSERIQTSESKEKLLEVLEEKFRRVAAKVTKNNYVLMVENINPTFGSINRADISTVTIQEKNDGFFVNASVNYKPPVLFWVLLVILLFTTVLWLIPIGFFFYQKNMVKDGIAEVFSGLKNELSIEKASSNNTQKSNNSYVELEKLAELRDKGILTQEEFESKKKKIISEF